MLRTFASVFLIVATSACAPSMTQVSATEAELCRSWGESLPTRSRMDTAQTSAEIQVGYADFMNACPAFEHLVPLRPVEGGR